MKTYLSAVAVSFLTFACGRPVPEEGASCKGVAFLDQAQCVASNTLASCQADDAWHMVRCDGPRGCYDELPAMCDAPFASIGDPCTIFGNGNACTRDGVYSLQCGVRQRGVWGVLTDCSRLSASPDAGIKGWRCVRGGCEVAE